MHHSTLRRLTVAALAVSTVTVLVPAAVHFGSAALAGTPDQVQREPMLRRASELVGMNVYNDKSEKLGSVDELVLNGSKDRISYVVLSYGGVMGIGDKLFAIPWRMVEHKPLEKDKLFINIDKDRLAAAPGFEKSHWPDSASADYWKSVNSYYVPDAEHMQSADKTLDEGSQTAWMRQVSQIEGADVKNPQDESLGDIKDLVIECHTGDVRYAVLSFGGWMGIDSKLFAVPMDDIKGSADHNYFVLDVTKDRLKAAPGFDKGQWPDMSDSHWSDAVDSYYKH